MPKQKIKCRTTVGNIHRPNRIYLPKKIFDAFELEYGDYLETEIVGKKIVMKPVKVKESE